MDLVSYDRKHNEDADGKTVTIKDTNGNVLVDGTSNYTITVDSYTEA